jgi:uncharacterized protein (DUF2252 family)
MDAAVERPRFTADGALGARGDVVIDAITWGDADFLRERPNLTIGKYLLMTGDAFTFFRGALSLYLHDWNDPASGLAATAFAAGDARPMGLGDAHPENFGTMRTAAGMFRLEPNDFDTADRVPYLWDVRRFAIGMCVAARSTNPGDASARAETAAADRAITRAAVVSYADTMRALAAGEPRPVIEGGGGNAVLDDLFMRSAEDWNRRAELDQLTVTNPVRMFVRGTPDPLEPLETTRDLPALARHAVAPAIAGYLATLPAPPAITELLPLDAVQVFGQGVGSFPRVRALVLVRGPTTGDGDDTILEIKELPPQGAPPLPGTTAFASPGARLRAALEAGFTERGADPLWGLGNWLGEPVQIRTEAAGFKTVRVSRLIGPLGTAAAVEGLGVALARLIARMHASPVGGGSVAPAIAAAIANDPDAFADEQTESAMRYCDQVASDWELFKQALALLGATLGVPGSADNAPTPTLRVLYDPDAEPASAGVDPIAHPIVINEISANGAEFVELANTTGGAQPLGGYGVADVDDDGGPRLSQAVWFSPGTMLAARAKLVVIGGHTPPAIGPQSGAACITGVASCYQAAWSISGSNGETLFLISPSNVIVDRASYPLGGLPVGQSWGRLPDASGPFSASISSASRPNTP